MSDIIHLLPDSVANQIAAGEVIQRPSSVLKELVENAIDAGATQIQIVIKDAGRTLIQVTDNGKGMSATDARMAFERHATSKIKDASDLFALRTMGFRGEALASIAAVAQVELRTKKEVDELGSLIEIAGTRVFNQEQIQCASGSSFLVKNLFFNVPARRRFLKSDNVEKSHILNEFYRIALVNPAVELVLYDGDEELYRLPSSNLKVRIDNVFGKLNKKKINQQLLTIEANTNLVSIEGFIGRPESAQKSAHQYFFVNGRYMRHPYFHKAVMLAYNNLISSTDNPSYFIYLHVEPDTLDINIHPTKTEIKFENEQAIWSIISATVKEALGKFVVAPSIDFDKEGAIDIPVEVQLENIRPPQTTFNPSYNPFQSNSYKRSTLDWEKLYEEHSSDSFLHKNEPSAEMFEHIEFKQDSSMQIVGDLGGKEFEVESQKTKNFQLKNRYVITSVKSGMLVIDQHRAHVRILFEELLSQVKHAKVPSQQLLFPEVLEMSHEDYLFFQSIEQELKEVGFDFHHLSVLSIEVRAVPAIIQPSTVVELLQSCIVESKNAGSSSVQEIHELTALSLAKSSAIKYGKGLSSIEMADLIDRLFACENHNHTPDGKIIMSIFSEDEISGRFN